MPLDIRHAPGLYLIRGDAESLYDEQPRPYIPGLINAETTVSLAPIPGN